MRIIVNDIAASRGGAMTILKQFYHYIKEHDTDNEWIFLLGNNCLQETDRIKVACYPQVKASRVKKVLFDCFYGKKSIRSYDPDVVVSLQNIITFGLKKPQIVYVHQSIPFQTIKKFSFFKKKERSIAFVQHIIGSFIKKSVKKADKVVVQTKWMQTAVAEATGVSPDKITIAFPDVELFEPDRSKFDTKRFFYPTGNAVYKNTDLIVEACNLLNAEGFDDFEVRLTLPENSIHHKNIINVGYLDKERLQEEYQSGTLIFPSYIETVGLPMLEARSSGTMVLASDLAFSHECLDGYENAFFFDPFDANALKECMKMIITNGFTRFFDEETIRFDSSWESFYKVIVSYNTEIKK